MAKLWMANPVRNGDCELILDLLFNSVGAFQLWQSDMVISLLVGVVLFLF